MDPKEADVLWVSVLTQRGPHLIACIYRPPGTTLAEALAVGKMRKGPPLTDEEHQKLMEEMIPKQYINYGLVNPEKHAKTDADYLRISYKEEDEAWMRDQELKQLNLNEQKKLDREVLTDNWQEDMSLYKHKRKKD